MQFVYLVFKLEFRAKKEYNGNKADLPSRSIGGVVSNISIQTRDTGDPGKTKDDKAGNRDYKAAKLEIIFEDTDLPTSRWHDENWRILDWNCTN